jgi:hypothetical protein
VSQLRDRMIEHLRLRGRAQNTIDAYTRCVRKFFVFTKVPPARVQSEHVRAYLLRLMDDRHVSCASRGVYVGAIKFSNPRLIVCCTSARPLTLTCRSGSGIATHFVYSPRQSIGRWRGIIGAIRSEST